ncbi:MAG TPA: Cof-type HAD-IIB family hydrolase [Candidatus Olsenella pullistercoris]|uniref:Cof-type HAD-IIB family hydrolase n=1 Tax=Candidatus Olsenella pullistercoris TaxID=2838712 RepID=A0A9D2JEL3_9ACTN|nr:Cof-type HAD-IIB family hydrolase [Candidatus Olsenella pullistercoris]
MTYELIAFDMDGTLLDSSKRVLPSSERAIADAADAGKTVAIASGRSPVMIELDQASLGPVRYAICCNGTVLYDLEEHRVVSSASLPREAIVAALDALGDEDAMIDVFQGRGFFCQPSHVDRMPEFGLGIYQPMYRATAWLVDDVRATLLDPSESYQKFIFHLTSPEARERVVAAMAGVPVEMARSEVSSLEFSPQGVTKATGLLALADLLGIDRAATIAVGDADNDLDMLRAAGLGVAMGNANERAREAADVTVADNDHDGCAEAIRRFLLGDEA